MLARWRPSGRVGDRPTVCERWLRRALALLVAALALAGCATGNAPEPILDSGTMSIESNNRRADGVAMTAEQNAFKMAGSTGARRGAATGGVASLACGPAVAICLPLFMWSGAFVGGTAGHVAGAVNDAFDLFPPKIAERIENVLVDIRRRRDFFAELRDAVSEVVPKNRQADAAVADTNVYVGPEGVQFIQDEPDMFALRMVGSMRVEKRTGGAPQEGEVQEYEYVTAQRPVDFWLSNEGAPFDRAFTEGVQKIALMMAWDLTGSQNNLGQ